MLRGVILTDSGEAVKRCCRIFRSLGFELEASTGVVGSRAACRRRLVADNLAIEVVEVGWLSFARRARSAASLGRLASLGREFRDASLSSLASQAVWGVSAFGAAAPAGAFEAAPSGPGLLREVVLSSSGAERGRTPREGGLFLSFVLSSRRAFDPPPGSAWGLERCSEVSHAMWPPKAWQDRARRERRLVEAPRESRETAPERPGDSRASLRPSSEGAPGRSLSLSPLEDVTDSPFGVLDPGAEAAAAEFCRSAVERSDSTRDARGHTRVLPLAPSQLSSGSERSQRSQEPRIHSLRESLRERPGVEER